MLEDVMNSFKSELHGLPFVTVTGNHDIRGTNAKEAYHAYMPERMSEELGKSITHTNFFFTIGDDAYIVLDFNDPDDTLIDQMLKECEGARHTFVLTHGPVLPYDGGSCRWFFHGESRLKRLLRVDIFVKYLPSGTLCVSVDTFIRQNWLIGMGMVVALHK